MRYGRAAVEKALAAIGVEDLTEQPHTPWASARCPLHDDDAPSFTVHMTEGGWRCHAGCGSDGDLAALIAEVTGDPIAEVRARLKDGAPPTDEELTAALAEPVYQPPQPRPDLVLLYEQGRAPKYIFDRGFTAETLRTWEVGYDANIEAVVIPVRMDGDLIGLVRRRVTGEPKYENTSFPKGGVLLGLDALPFGFCDEIVVVEGPLDAMWLHQHGVHAVALLGSSMSERQADLLAGRFWAVVLAFDADSSGEVCRVQAEMLLKARGVPTRWIRMPEGRGDPQECTAEEIEVAFGVDRSVRPADDEGTTSAQEQEIDDGPPNESTG